MRSITLLCILCYFHLHGIHLATIVGVSRGAYTCVLCVCLFMCLFMFISILNALSCSSVAHSAVDLVQELSTQSEWTTGPVPPPDQLGSKARLMTVVNLASEEWSCTHRTASLCDWVGCVCVCMHACVYLRVFVNVSRGLNDDKQMPAVGASTHNLASFPPEMTHATPPCHLTGPHLVTLWGCRGEGEMNFYDTLPF